MPDFRYLNFDLVIERSDQGYRARVLNLPVPEGPVESDFQLPFSDADIKIFLLTASQIDRRVRRDDSPAMRAARDFGGRLFAAVFGAEVEACFERRLDEATKPS